MVLSKAAPKPLTVDGILVASHVMEVRTTLPCLSSGSAGMSQETNKSLEFSAYSVILVGGPTGTKKSSQFIDFERSDYTFIIPRQLS